MNSENPVVSVITLGKTMLQNARKHWAELLEGPSTRTALVILVLGVVTLLYSLHHDLTALPW
ncbi:MAG: hypothetical protein WB036_01025 [Pseudolabrys sp.]